MTFNNLFANILRSLRFVVRQPAEEVIETPSDSDPDTDHGDDQDTDLVRLQPFEPDEPEENPFVLDAAPDGMGNWVANELVQERPPFPMPIDDAYVLLSAELRRRGMDEFIIPIEQFRREWVDGIQRTQVFMSPDGRSGMSISGCAISDFTRVAKNLVTTAVWNAPTAIHHVNIGGRAIVFGFAYGQIRTVYERVAA